MTLDLGRITGAHPSADTPAVIPKKSTSGVASVVDVADAFTIADAQASVSLTHGDVGELRIVLQSPSGTSVTLHDHSQPGTADLSTTYDRLTQPDGPGTMNDFDGEPSQGAWTLTVVDDVSGAVPPGVLDGWSLELTATAPYRCNPLTCADPVPAAMGASLRVSPSGTDDLAFTWDVAVDATEYRVWRSTSPEMAGAEMVGQTAGTSLVEAGGQADPAAAVFYQVRAVNSCEWEGP